MADDEIVQIDIGLVEELTKREVAALDEKHARSLAYRDEAKAHLPGGVSSSWQMWPPHPIYVDRGLGAHVWDIDGNEYVDYHNGYGVMVMGHAHPKIVEAVQKRVALGTHFAQPTEDALPVAEQLAERTGLPYWRFGNSGTEATLDVVRIMRASTGRDLVVKIEGTYHGHHDALMVSVFPPRDKAGPREHPTSVPQTKGLIPGTTDWIVNVPFNDLEAAQQVFAERGDEIAGMIIEPVMTNCGVVLPDPGYLDGLKEVCHTHGALFAYDEVKTGFTRRVGRRDRGLRRAARPGGVRQGARRRAAVRRDRRHRGGDGRRDRRRASSRSARSTATRSRWRPPRSTSQEVLVKDAYVRLDEINTILRRCDDVIDRYHLPASMKTLGAKGSIDWSLTPIHEYRDLWEIDDRIPQLAWLWQLNRGVFKSPGSKWESWTTSIVMSDEDAQRYVDNFESMAAAISQ